MADRWINFGFISLPLGTLKQVFLFGEVNTFTVDASTDLITTPAAHNLIVGDRVRFKTTGSLPGGLLANTTFYVIAAGFTTTTIKVSLTLGGAAVDITTAGTGTHTLMTSQLFEALTTVTVQPADETFTAALVHHFLAGDRVRFTTTGTLPAPLAVDTDYYVIAAGMTSLNFRVSTTLGGSAIDITSVGTGTHSVHTTKEFAIYVPDLVFGATSDDAATYPVDEVGGNAYSFVGGGF